MSPVWVQACCSLIRQQTIQHFQSAWSASVLTQITPAASQLLPLWLREQKHVLTQSHLRQVGMQLNWKGFTFCVFTLLFFSFLLSTQCCSTESKRQCDWLHLIVSLLEPPTFTAPEWEDSILPYPCDWSDIKYAKTLHNNQHLEGDFLSPSLLYVSLCSSSIHCGPGSSECRHHNADPFRWYKSLHYNIPIQSVTFFGQS